MAKFIATPEKIEEINELYYKIGVKKQVAELVGCSASTVTKYLKKNWKPKEKQIDFDFNNLPEPEGPSALIAEMQKNPQNPNIGFCQFCILSEDEWLRMREIQNKYVSS